MKRGLTIAAAGLILGWLGVDIAAAQNTGTPPALSITLTLSRTLYRVGDATDPIAADITVKNVGATAIITSAGFSSRPFHLFLEIIGPDGRKIPPKEGSGGGEGPPPTIVLVNNQYVQVEEVETLPVDFTKTVRVTDLRAFYDLAKAGRYSAKVVVSTRTYPAVTTMANGRQFAAIDSFNFSGVIESNTVKFTLVADADGDTFAFPEPDPRRTDWHATLADCDDNNAAANPAATEIPGDGIDNDCNPLTVDGVLGVKIDIKPGSFPNSINQGSGGTVPVAIFSTATFDATTIDPATVTLADAHVKLRGRGTPMASFQDVNGDGRLDLVVHVETEALEVSASDTEAELKGSTFVRPQRPAFHIRGVDSVRIVP